MLKTIYNRTSKSKVWALGIGLLSILVTEIVLTCLIPAWRESFYNILNLKKQSLFTETLIYFMLLMTGLGFVQGLKVWVGQLLSFQFRIATSKLLLKTWVKGKQVVSNYTQAQTEAIRNATELYLEIAVEVFISASIVIMLIIANLHNTPILVAALIYTVAASALAALFNKPLINADIGAQNSEGLYREAISDIANGNGDFSSKGKFILLMTTYYRYIKVVMYYTLFSRIKGSLASLIPYVLLGSAYFAGSITLGVFMAGVATFELIVINATILVVLYPKLTKARASYKIVQTFYKEITK